MCGDERVVNGLDENFKTSAVKRSTGSKKTLKF